MSAEKSKFDIFSMCVESGDFVKVGKPVRFTIPFEKQDEEPVQGLGYPMNGVCCE